MKPTIGVVHIPAIDASETPQPELRISSVDLSADWITAEYNNQATPFTFYTMGSFAPPPAGFEPDED